MKSGLFKNKKGVSIIQVLMAAGMTSIVSLGLVTMIENSRRMQRRTTLMTTLSDVRSRLENFMRDQVAFNNTVNMNSSTPFLEMKAGSAVPARSLSNPAQFILFDAGGTSYNMLGIGASDSAGQRYWGFTERGGPCQDFNPILGLGDDKCPISYRLLVVPECLKPGQTSCRDPQLRMVARLVFNPGTGVSSTMNSWRGLIPTVSSSSLVDASEKYDAEVRRTPSKINKGFIISASVSKTGSTVLCDSAAVTNTGGGTCTVGSFANHPLQFYRANEAPGWERESDPHSLVTASSSTGHVRFTDTGMYRCVIVAKAFSTNLTVQLYNVSSTTSVGTGTAVLSQYAEGEARADITVNVTNTQHAYIIRQQCSSAALNSCTLGFAKANYTTGERLLWMTCDRMDEMF